MNKVALANICERFLERAVKQAKLVYPVAPLDLSWRRRRGVAGRYGYPHGSADPNRHTIRLRLSRYPHVKDIALVLLHEVGHAKDFERWLESDEPRWCNVEPPAEAYAKRRYDAMPKWMMKLMNEMREAIVG